MLHSLTIQGPYAVHFQLKNHNCENFRQLLKTLTSGHCVLISSKFRTEILYESPEDLSESILRLWNMYVGEDAIKPVHRNRMVHHDGEREVFQFYFTSLISLNRIKDWYKLYVEAFRNMCSMEPTNPIINQLIDCDQFLSEKLLTSSREGLLIPMIGSRVLMKPETFRELAVLAMGRCLN